MNKTLIGIINMAYDFGQDQLKTRLNDPADPMSQEKSDRILKVTELGQRILNVFVDDNPDNVDQLEEILDKMLDAGVDLDEF